MGGVGRLEVGRVKWREGGVTGGGVEGGKGVTRGRSYARLVRRMDYISIDEGEGEGEGEG